MGFLYPLVILSILLIFFPFDSSSRRTLFFHGGSTTTTTTTSTDAYCNSWMYSVETNNIGDWPTIPIICQSFVAGYMNGTRYLSDSKVVASYSLAFAKDAFTGGGKDAWIFDVDETLISNLHYYAENGYGSEIFNETKWNEWVLLSAATALPASLELYNNLKSLGFKIMILTGRGEEQREITQKNLNRAGYSGWEKFILRGDGDGGKTNVKYKSEKRAMLESEGYTIHGCSGDQWSDLSDSPTAKRSFKLPNPMYYIA
ncbi:Acid phosphatase-like protein [Zostera marina]|uniref:Acid phosphatase-like protein n=1 Tax=Zostera marina TaxID=29655 RepID=A0A0K9PHI6_ZOSMR|nr:Acid phosphatase-like protein [Zostera marina]